MIHEDFVRIVLVGQHGAEVVGPQQHQADREQRAKEGSYSVERLTQAKGGSAQARRCEVGDQRVTRRAPDALGNSIQQPGRKHHAGRRRDGKERLGQRAQGLAEHRETLALAQVVA